MTSICSEARKVWDWPFWTLLPANSNLLVHMTSESSATETKVCLRKCIYKLFSGISEHVSTLISLFCVFFSCFSLVDKGSMILGILAFWVLNWSRYDKLTPVSTVNFWTCLFSECYCWFFQLLYDFWSCATQILNTYTTIIPVLFLCQLFDWWTMKIWLLQFSCCYYSVLKFFQYLIDLPSAQLCTTMFITLSHWE